MTLYCEIYEICQTKKTRWFYIKKVINKKKNVDIDEENKMVICTTE